MPDDLPCAVACAKRILNQKTVPKGFSARDFVEQIDIAIRQLGSFPHQRAFKTKLRLIEHRKRFAFSWS